MNAARSIGSASSAISVLRGSAATLPVARSAAMRDVLAAAEDVAVGSTTVLILGESGTGKEVVARHIHRCSPRAGGPWVAVNCAAVPAELLESELFGHERGAFTGAVERRAGRIEQADKGTLLLDEISELPPALQAKLLRVLQEREVDRLGGGRSVPVDVRIIATSNRDLAQMVERKQFRADLYYRLFVFPIVIAPLRERTEDIGDLSQHLLHKLAAELGRPAPTLTEAALGALRQYRFPGNVRELGNLLERAMVRCRFPVLDAQHLGLGGPEPRDSAAALGRSERAPMPERRFLPEGVPIDLASLERLAVQEALRRENGNRTHAARVLGISLRTLRNKLREYRSAGNPERVPGPSHDGLRAASRAPSTREARAESADGQMMPAAAPDGVARGSDDHPPIEGLLLESRSARSSHLNPERKEHTA
jgi:DNA-binding NtrC family response regulator